MRKTLQKTLIAIICITILSILLSLTIRYSSRELVYIIIGFSLFCSIPIFLGYLLSVYLLKKQNKFLRVINITLIIGNALLIVWAFALCIIGSSFEPIILLAFLYVGTGCYLYYHTLKNYRSIPKEISIDDYADVLDDDFSES
jgi:hypothetical protein